MDLTPKQKAFADEYIKNGGNATDAARKAGYAERSARDIGNENLTKPHISLYMGGNLRKPTISAYIAENISKY